MAQHWPPTAARPSCRARDLHDNDLRITFSVSEWLLFGSTESHTESHHLRAFRRSCQELERDFLHANSRGLVPVSCKLRPLNPSKATENVSKGARNRNGRAAGLTLSRPPAGAPLARRPAPLRAPALEGRPFLYHVLQHNAPSNHAKADLFCSRVTSHHFALRRRVAVAEP